MPSSCATDTPRQREREERTRCSPIGATCSSRSSTTTHRRRRHADADADKAALASATYPCSTYRVSVKVHSYLTHTHTHPDVMRCGSTDESALSLILPLNDSFLGGGTFFADPRLQAAVRPRPGQVCSHLCKYAVCTCIFICIPLIHTLLKP